MKLTKMIFGASLITLAGAALANDIYPFPELDAFKSTKTRAEVSAEVTQARAQHALTSSLEVNYPPQAEVTATRSRQEVKNEALQAAKHHGAMPDYAG